MSESYMRHSYRIVVSTYRGEAVPRVAIARRMRFICEYKYDLSVEGSHCEAEAKALNEAEEVAACIQSVPRAKGYTWVGVVMVINTGTGDVVCTLPF